MESAVPVIRTCLSLFEPTAHSQKSTVMDPIGTQIVPTGYFMNKTIKAMASDRLKRLRKLRVFDSNLWLGQPVGFPLAEELKPNRLPEALKKHCIAGGLVSHWRGYTVSAQDGNLALERIMPALPANVYAIWTALPLYPPEQSPMPGHGKLPAKVRGVRIFPAHAHFPLEKWSLGALCKWLIERRMPLFIWHTELEWSRLRTLAGDFPELRIIVETQTQKILYHTRPLFALMKERANVSLEISNFAGPGFIEFAVREFGAQRLIYGSFLPVNDPFVPAGMLLDADISDSDRELIAGINMRRIIDRVLT